jgi:integrase
MEEEMKKQKLPRGLTVRGNSIIATFALCDGAIARRAVGVAGVTSTQECQRRRLEFVRQVDLGTYESPKPRPERVKEVTCANLWDAYKRDCQNREKRVDRLETAWRHLELPFGQKAAAAVRTGDLVEYTAERRAAKITNGTINRELAVLKAAFRYGARSEMISRIPMFPRRLKEARPRQGFVEDKQYKVLAANARDLWLRTFLALGYNFGLRKGELLALRVRDVDLLDGRLTVETSKNGEGRRIALTQETKTLLAECVRGKQPDDFVLTRQDGGRVAQPRKDWYNLCVASGLGKLDEDGGYEGLQMHDLRRSAVRRLVRRGVPERVCMAISGHKTRSVFDRYNITSERDLENAARLIERDGQPSVPVAGTDTKTDTSVFAHT